MAKRRRKVVKALLAIAGVLLLLLGLAVVLLPLLVQVEALRSRVAAAAASSLDRQVSMGDMELKLLGGPAVKVQDLRVQERAGFGGGRFVQAERAELSLSFWPLLRGQVEVDGFELRSPSLVLRRNAQGVWNISDLLPEEAAPTEPEQPARVSVERARIKDGRLLVIDRKGRSPRRFEVSGVNLDLRDYQPGETTRIKVEGMLPADSDNRFSMQITARNLLVPEQPPATGSRPPSYDVSLATGGVPVDSIPLADTLARLLDGMIGLEGELKWKGEGAAGFQRTASGQLELALEDGQLTTGDLAPQILAAAGFPDVLPAGDTTKLRKLKGKLELKEGRMHTEGLSLNTDVLSSQLKGSIGLDQRLDLEGEATFQEKKVLDRLREHPVAKALIEDDELSFPFGLGGTLRSPKVTVDADQLVERARERGGEQLEQELRDYLRKPGKDLQQKLEGPLRDLLPGSAGEQEN